MRYLHTMIRVSNLSASVKFFELLGMVETYRMENQDSRYTLVFLAADGDVDKVMASNAPCVELTHNWDEPEYTEGRNFGHLAYEVENIYEICQRLTDAGVTINRPPRDGYMAFVRTPDNISVELLQSGKPLPTIEPWVSAKNIGNW